jgi:hypothetical protein
MGRALFKCTLPDGKIAYKDTPCDTEADQQKIQMHGGTQKQVSPPPSADATPKEAPPPPRSRSLVPTGARADRLQHLDAAGGKCRRRTAVEYQRPGFAASRPDVGRQCVLGNDLDCAKKGDDPKTAMDACFKSAPRCATPKPWEEPKACCPDACWQKYSELRRKCVDPSSASTRAIYDGHCAPGPPDAAD